MSLRTQKAQQTPKTSSPPCSHDSAHTKVATKPVETGAYQTKRTTKNQHQPSKSSENALGACGVRRLAAAGGFSVSMRGSTGGGELQCANCYQRQFGGDSFPPRKALSASLCSHFNEKNKTKKTVLISIAAKLFSISFFKKHFFFFLYWTPSVVFSSSGFKQPVSAKKNADQELSAEISWNSSAWWDGRASLAALKPACCSARIQGLINCLIVFFFFFFSENLLGYCLNFHTNVSMVFSSTGDQIETKVQSVRCVQAS